MPTPKAANSPSELKNTCFMGTNVQSGTATAVVVLTGVHTYLGTMASSITQEGTPTSFDQGGPQPFHLAHDPAYGHYGAAGFLYHRIYKARLEGCFLLCHGGGCGTDSGDVRRFILCVGPISSIFDYSTFFVMLWVFRCWDPSRASVFQTGRFVESLMTQTLVIHIIRTNKIPFLQSRASWSLTITTLSIMAFGSWLPYSPVASSLGLPKLPGMYWPILLLTLLAYTGLTQTVKVRLLRMKWI